MKYSGIGGQAVLEGIMMKNGQDYAVAVRKPDGEIEIKKDRHESFSDKHKWAKWPFIRGIFAFVDSLALGMSTLSWSASFAETGEEEKNGKKETGLSKAETTITVIIAVLLAVGVFVVLPTFLSNLLKRWITSMTLIAVLEGVIRLVIFIGYVSAISLMKDIRRVYMYHGSEHKCINCIESGLPLTVENVMKSSKEHRRCGTSFLLIVMLISIILFIFIRIEYLPLRMLSRLLLIPVVAGISYEILRINGRFDNKLTWLISRPGMWMQALTTREPDEKMAEVAIRAVEAVFDWKKFLEENFS
ncbi:MAG: DUF1385 domain-containing protein [Lachnospiraceae bacterium]|nr:DUF1385 domain-containing protein [Lachnospiraceae bacterium]